MSFIVLCFFINLIIDGILSECIFSFIISVKVGFNIDVSVGVIVDGNIRGSSGVSIGLGIGVSIDLSDIIWRFGIIIYYSDSLDREGSFSIDLSGIVLNFEGFLVLYGFLVVEIKVSFNNNLSKILLKDGWLWKYVDLLGIDNSLNVVWCEKDCISELVI